MITIWGRTNSTNVKKVLWAAEELGLPYENIPAGGVHGVVNDPDFRALNPNGLVPVLKDGDLVLWESNVIVRYLAGRYGDGRLIPADAGARAKAERWMDWATGTIAAPFRDLFWNLVRLAPEQRDAKAMEAGLARVADLLAILDAELARQPYLTGDTFGIGDIPLGPVIYAWFALPIERPARPHVEAWYHRLAERPAYRKTVMLPLS